MHSSVSGSLRAGTATAPDEAPAAFWCALRETRVPITGLDRERVPTQPGILVLYRGDRMAWFGKSVNLRATIRNTVAIHGPGANSPLRRSIATYLGLTTLEALAANRYRLTPDDHARISGWIRECGVAWRACASESKVVRLEARLLAEPDPLR